MHVKTAQRQVSRGSSPQWGGLVESPWNFVEGQWFWKMIVWSLQFWRVLEWDFKFWIKDIKRHGKLVDRSQSGVAEAGHYLERAWKPMFERLGKVMEWCWDLGTAGRLRACGYGWWWLIGNWIHDGELGGPGDVMRHGLDNGSDGSELASLPESDDGRICGKP